MNNITNITGKYNQAFINQTGESQRAENRKDPVGETKPDVPNNDRVSLSTKSKDYMVAQAAVNKVPDIREAKVAEIKQAIADGRYNVNAEKVAEKLIGAIINDVI